MTPAGGRASLNGKPLDVTTLGSPPVADGWTLHAVVDHKTLRPTRLPEWLREAIETAEPSSPQVLSGL